MSLVFTTNNVVPPSKCWFCVLIGLFCVWIGLFFMCIGLFRERICLFCVWTGRFCVQIVRILKQTKTLTIFPTNTVLSSNFFF